MTDIYDRAQALEQFQREQAIASQQAASRSSGQTYSHCSDCGDDIPLLRQQAVPGCTRCIDCQQLRERYASR